MTSCPLCRREIGFITTEETVDGQDKVFPISVVTIPKPSGSDPLTVKVASRWRNFFQGEGMRDIMRRVGPVVISNQKWILEATERYLDYISEDGQDGSRRLTRRAVADLLLDIDLMYKVMSHAHVQPLIGGRHGAARPIFLRLVNMKVDLQRRSGQIHAYPLYG
jgi:hypothetical protein